VKVFVDSIGCRLNQSEIETIAARFRAQGYELVDKADNADLVVINTCAVTGKAVADSRSSIRHAAAREGVRVIATGCWATLEPAEVAGLSGRVQVVGNPDKELIWAQFPAETGQPSGSIARVPLPGGRFRTRAFIKVQDGCDNYCTFCITRLARGPACSKTVDEVLSDVTWAAAGGVRELVLTGVNLGSWGKDFSPARSLRELIEAILAHTDVPRLRLSSLEPWHLDGQFFELWDNPRMCRHLHLPVQSGSDAVLKRMGRLTRPAEFAGQVMLARRAAPDMAISTDLIAGFPGEEEQQFAETLAFVHEMKFASGHVFAYSPRPGTPAALLSGRIASAEVKRRARLLREAFEQTGREYRSQFVGKVVNVLWESATRMEDGQWQMEGLSGNSLRVQSTHTARRWNHIDRVLVETLRGRMLVGHILAADLPLE
jgi:threonylcarbamoyladenosine tRNA methylthiotransferase MtaB